VWADGRVVGVWDQTADGELRTHLVTSLTPEQRAALDDRLSDLRSTIGDTRFTVRFPSPVSSALRAGSATHA
jgi:hypothetical protein